MSSFLQNSKLYVFVGGYFVMFDAFDVLNYSFSSSNAGLDWELKIMRSARLCLLKSGESCYFMLDAHVSFARINESLNT